MSTRVQNARTDEVLRVWIDTAQYANAETRQLKNTLRPSLSHSYVDQPSK